MIASQTKNVECLAERLEKDIRRRGLSSGDRYLIAREAGHFLDVSTTTAHRVLTMLAERKVLVRQRGAGTFVGPAFKPGKGKNGTKLNLVHVLMAMDYYRTAGFPRGTFVGGIESVLPDTAVQIHYVPEHNSLGYTKQVVDRVRTAGTCEGIILIRSTKYVQSYVEQSKLPAVVFGSVYPSVKSLCWLDVDQVATGQVMAQYAIDRGHRDFVLLMRNEWRQGDNILLNSITQQLGDAGMGMDALKLLSVPCDRDLITQEVSLLFESMKRPSVILCRSDYYADVVLEVAEKYKLKINRDFELISGSHPRAIPSSEYPCIVPAITWRDQVSMLVKLLCQIVSKEQTDFQSTVIPVELYKPN